MPGLKSGVHEKTCVVREGTEVRRSCATVPSAFPPCSFDLGLYCVFAELDGQVALSVNEVSYFSFKLRVFSSLFVSESKELAMMSTAPRGH